MMDGLEKSDSGIVAAKPTNKAGQPAAELVEPRPETKGSAEQQRMHRTQSRDRMFQSLDRVRKAARLRKKVVAALIASNLLRISGARSKWPCRSIASTRTGSNAFSRFPQTRSDASHSNMSALRSASP